VTAGEEINPFSHLDLSLPFSLFLTSPHTLCEKTKKIDQEGCDPKERTKKVIKRMPKNCKSGLGFGQQSLHRSNLANNRNLDR